MGAAKGNRNAAKPEGEALTAVVRMRCTDDEKVTLLRVAEALTKERGYPVKLGRLQREALEAMGWL